MSFHSGDRLKWMGGNTCLFKKGKVYECLGLFFMGGIFHPIVLREDGNRDWAHKDYFELEIKEWDV